MLQKLLPFIKEHRWVFLGASLLSMSGYGVWLFIPWIMGEIITFAAEYEFGGSAQTAWNYLGFIALAALYYYASIEIGRGTLRWLSEQISLDIKRKVLEHLTLLDLRWHENENSGSKLKKINRAGQSIKKLFNMYTDLGLDVFISMIGIPIIFAFLSWELILILIVFFIVHYFLSTWLTRRAMAQNRRVNTAEEKLSGMEYEIMNHVLTIKSMGMNDSILAWAQNQMNLVLLSIKKRIVLFRSRMAILGFERQIFRLLIIGVAVWKVIEGDFEVGMIAQVYFYFGKVEVTADRISSITHQWSLSKVDMEALWEIMEVKADIESSGTEVFSPEWQQIKLHHVSFNFDQKPVLKDFSLTINKGEKIGIVGLSGAGKSTLMRLMLKIYDNYEGFIGFDNTSLATIHRSSYIKHIGVVLQETELFNFSIKDNICIASSNQLYNEDRLEQALALAQLNDFVKKQEQGWDTDVGEKGLKLSGGERQRLGIARAIYRQPHILFLDEATSHLDSHSERKIQAALDLLFKDITAIVIAHRLSTLKKMDRIIVMEKGRVVQEGTFKELSVKDGLFRELLNTL